MNREIEHVVANVIYASATTEYEDYDEEVDGALYSDYGCTKPVSRSEAKDLFKNRCVIVDTATNNMGLAIGYTEDEAETGEKYAILVANMGSSVKFITVGDPSTTATSESATSGDNVGETSGDNSGGSGANTSGSSGDNTGDTPGGTSGGN